MQIILVDGHTIVRCALKTFLEVSSDHEVVGGAASGDEALCLVSKQSCDLVVLDINLDDLEGVSVIRELRSRNETLPILILSQFTEIGTVSQALAAGANGYVVKSARPEDLLAALDIVGGGGVYIHPKVARAIFEPAVVADDNFTVRERAVLELLVNGASNERVAAVLHVSVSTVKGHLRSLFAKFGVSDRTHLVAEAVSRGVVQTRPSAEAGR